MKANRILIPPPSVGRSVVVFALFCLFQCGATAAQTPQPCSTKAPIRQLDYLLGVWSIDGSGVPSHAIGKVSSSLSGCILVEHWENGQGYVGEYTFAYNPDEKWRGFFADNQGHVHVIISGKVSPESAEFFAPSMDTNGEAILNRIRFVRLDPNRVEKTWDKSPNDGSTWTNEYRRTYTRIPNTKAGAK